MHVKSGDKVRVMAGKDRGKEGKITQVFTVENRVVVEGVNKISKHLRTRRQGTKGEKITLFGPVAAAKVMIVCAKCNQPTRTGHKFLENGKKVRICKNCGEVI